MIKAAIEKIAAMAYPRTFKSPQGHLYYDNGTDYALIEAAPSPLPRELDLSSLDAVDKLVHTELADWGGSLYISVPSPTRVEVFGTPQSGVDPRRVQLCCAKAVDVPGFKDTTYSYEQAMIALRSRFQDSPDRAYLLDLMSHLVSGQEVTTEDDGVTQQVKVRTGIQMVGVTQTKPIVCLRPYRTFQEVDQPESEFLIRLDDKRNLTITEADGGMWKLHARETVAAWLRWRFREEIETGHVVVML